MLKNIFLLGLLTWVSISYAKTPVVKESIADSESYKVDKAVTEQEAERSVAGAKIKKKKRVPSQETEKFESSSEPDSEVRYWQYSE